MRKLKVRVNIACRLSCIRHANVPAFCIISRFSQISGHPTRIHQIALFWISNCIALVYVVTLNTSFTKIMLGLAKCDCLLGFCPGPHWGMESPRPLISDAWCLIFRCWQFFSSISAGLRMCFWKKLFVDSKADVNLLLICMRAVLWAVQSLYSS